MIILGEYKMGHGDLYRLTGEVNAKYTHGIPREPGVTKLRVSIVFRCVTLFAYDPVTNEKVNRHSGEREAAVSSLSKNHYDEPLNQKKIKRVAELTSSMHDGAAAQQ